MVRVALHVDPTRRPRGRRLRNGALDHRRGSDPDARNPGQHRQAELHDQPDELRLSLGALEGVGDQGTAAAFSSYFHVVNCAGLGFKPRMSITQLGGGKSTGRSKNPSLRFDLRTREGDANIKSIAVTLSKAFEVDQRHLGNICSKLQLEREHCAGRQPIGTVKTETPLLEKPLEGPAYAVSGYGGLPHVVFILGGQVTLLPEARSKTVNGGHLRTTVSVVPDAPIGHFRLNLYGGKRGYLTNTRSLCSAPVVSEVEYVGQNGKTVTQQVSAKTSCGAKAARRHRGA